MALATLQSDRQTVLLWTVVVGATTMIFGIIKMLIGVRVADHFELAKYDAHHRKTHRRCPIRDDCVECVESAHCVGS
jgi:hypothetical protein